MPKCVNYVEQILPIVAGDPLCLKCDDASPAGRKIRQALKSAPPAQTKSSDPFRPRSIDRFQHPRFNFRQLHHLVNKAQFLREIQSIGAFRFAIVCDVPISEH
jgi:hypothetical protein